MKHKTWFGLIIKAIGVYCLALGVPEALAVAAYMAGSYFEPAFPRSAWSLMAAVKPVLQLIIGFWLFFGARWIVNLAIPSNRPYCPECGYDISSGAGAGCCPECGVALPDPSRPRATARANEPVTSKSAEQ
jgi:hypothetical protein